MKGAVVCCARQSPTGCAVDLKIRVTKCGHFEDFNMAGVVSTVRGGMQLIQGLTINENYPDGRWIVQELIPALSAVVRRLGTVEEHLEANTHRDWWMIVLTAVFSVGISVIVGLLVRRVGNTRATVDSVGKGVINLGTKLNVQPTSEFPQTVFR